MKKAEPTAMPCLLCGGAVEYRPGNHSVAINLGESIGINVYVTRCTQCGVLRFFDKDLKTPVYIGSPPER